MKKIVSMILVLVMAMSLGVPAIAAEITNNDAQQSANTTVKYGLDEGYIVVIPDSVVIDVETEKGQATLSAENVLIGYNKTLNVRVSGNDYSDAWELIDTADANNKLKYTIGKTDGADDVVNNTVVLSTEAGANYNSKVEQVLYFELDEVVTKAGSYVDTLTFTVNVE